ncbi:MAG: phage tail sheath family protein, partial [Acidobacteriota bacterium]
MPAYLHPGVYIEEIPSGAKPIEGVSTSTAAFVGYATKGPVGDPVLIFKFDDYVRRYGGLRDLGKQPAGDPLGFAVKAFFQNGGTKAYIVRLAQGDATTPLAAAMGYLGVPGSTTDVLEVSALNQGTWGDGLIVKATQKEADPTLYTVEVGREDDRGELAVLETFQDASFDDASPRFIEGVLNGVSENVRVEIKARADVTIPADNFRGTLTSADLSAVGLDLSAASETDRTLELTLDGTASAVTVVLPAQAFASLGDVASEIQSQVRGGGATATRRTDFTAEAQDDALVLTSGTRTADSSVAAGGALAATLLLREADGAVDHTGAETLSLLDEVELSGGGDGEGANDAAYDAVFTAFEKIRDISILCLPGKAWDSTGQPVIQSAVSHAERMKSRMVIIDPPADTELTTEKNVTDLGLPTSTYGVLYYPWVKVANPFFDAEDNPGVPTTLLVPPGGYAAGMWS